MRITGTGGCKAGRGPRAGLPGSAGRRGALSVGASTAGNGSNSSINKRDSPGAALFINGNKKPRPETGLVSFIKMLRNRYRYGVTILNIRLNLSCMAKRSFTFAWSPVILIFPLTR